MPGLVPGIPLQKAVPPKRDGRDKPGHDEVGSRKAGLELKIGGFGPFAGFDLFTVGGLNA